MTFEWSYNMTHIVCIPHSVAWYLFVNGTGPSQILLTKFAIKPLPVMEIIKALQAVNSEIFIFDSIH